MKSSQTPITSADVWPLVKQAIRATITKFREHPDYFFTESDLHSYLYHRLYSGRLEVVRQGRRFYLVHREYPTNFRYLKDSLLLDEFTEPYPLSSRQGDRGNYDVAVISPEFASSAQKIQYIVNKNVRDLETRVDADPDAVRRELLFAIEFKYVTRNSLQFVAEVAQDNKKLVFASRWGAKAAVNLVFCNHADSYAEQVRSRVLAAPMDILAGFIQAHHMARGKITPREVWNQPLGLDWLGERFAVSGSPRKEFVTTGGTSFSSEGGRVS